MFLINNIKLFKLIGNLRRRKMGILSVMRLKLENLSEWSYRIGQLHGEKKKIKDKRRLRLINTINFSDEESQKIDNFYKKNYSNKGISYKWHKLYQSFTGNFDEKYLPEYIFSSLIEPMWNPKPYRDVLSDKNLLTLYCNGVDEVREPIIYGSCISGLYRNKNLHPVTEGEFIDILFNVGQTVIKPTIDSGSGKNIQFLSIKDGIDIYTKRTLKDIIREYNGDFNIQECIKNSNLLSCIYPDSVNTFRVVTYIWNGKIYHMPIALRIGQGGYKIDNAHAGGMFIGVSDDGYLSSCAYTEFKDEYYQHPDTGFVFKNYNIPSVQQIIKQAKIMHAKTPQLRVMSWDLTLDRDNVIVLIEVNTIGQTVWFPQMANGKSAFGDNTAEILHTLKSKKS